MFKQMKDASNDALRQQIAPGNSVFVILSWVFIYYNSSSELENQNCIYYESCQIFTGGLVLKKTIMTNQTIACFSKNATITQDVILCGLAILVTLIVPMKTGMLLLY